MERVIKAKFTCGIADEGDESRREGGFIVVREEEQGRR